MAAPESIGYDELDEVVANLRLSIPASELHGSMCGLLAAGGRLGKRSVLNALHLEAAGDSVSDYDQGVLDQVAVQSAEELTDPELGFEPLLPADDRPLPERAGALVDWCRGFLSGFGLNGADAHGRLSDEGQEILRDLGTIASVAIHFGDADEDEDALIEVHEFVRMGAMLVFTECHVPHPSSSGTLH
jgi:uncharacterized protein YgfB (UPF0149 family)